MRKMLHVDRNDSTNEQEWKPMQDHNTCVTQGGKEKIVHDRYARDSPLTASPVPSTSRSSSSIRLLMRFGRVIGLARPIDVRMVGLANGSPPLCEIGDDETDPVAEDVIGTGIGPRDEELERGIYIGESDV
jgi:hypothetical protein